MFSYSHIYATKLLRGAGASWKKFFVKIFRVRCKWSGLAIGPEKKRGVVLPAWHLAPESALNSLPWLYAVWEGKSSEGRERDVAPNLEFLWDPQPLGMYSSRHWRPVGCEQYPITQGGGVTLYKIGIPGREGSSGEGRLWVLRFQF